MSSAEQGMRVHLGAPGRIMPPADKAIEFAQQAEADGFDAIWWPCHLMGWTPDSMWTDDVTPLRQFQASPHTYLEPLTMMGAAGAMTERIRVGVCVTDTIRRHPAMLAQQALTVDHLAGGRSILGLGSGERMNVTPYGIEWTKPVGRLEEAIAVIRLLWEAEGPVDFDGRFFRLEDAVLGLEPFEGKPPPIWLAAHGPRMLDICGRLADGWLPTNISPEAYAEKLAAIYRGAEGAGRDPAEITPSMLAYVMCAPDEETLERMCEAPLARLLFAAVDLGPDAYERHGTTSPFEGGSGGMPRIWSAAFSAAASTPSCRPPSRAPRRSGSSPTSPPGSSATTPSAGPRPRSPRRSRPTARRGCATPCSGTSPRSATRRSRATRSRRCASCAG